MNIPLVEKSFGPGVAGFEYASSRIETSLWPGALIPHPNDFPSGGYWSEPHFQI